MANIILSSTSPRRKQLLEQINLPFTIQTTQVNESYPKHLSPKEVVMYLANKKAEAISSKQEDAFVIGADTIVVFENEILGKPESSEEARQVLKKLSGNTHSVYTGVSIHYKREKEIFYEKTLVTFWELTNEEIEGYLHSGEPFDKAGSYGIQGIGAAFVRKIDGDYFSVVGLPVAKVYRQLRRMGYVGPPFSFSS